MEGFLAAVVLIFTFGMGWSMSAATIGKECEQQGSFYIENKVYECHIKPAKQEGK